MIKLFTIEEHPDGYKISLDYEACDFERIKSKGSYNVPAARVLGLSYADYCRYCRDVHGATLVGKGTNFPLPIYKTRPYALVNELNSRTTKILESL